MENKLSARQQRILQEYRDREDKRPENGMLDHRHGYDDDQPLTTPDFNHYEGVE